MFPALSPEISNDLRCIDLSEMESGNGKGRTVIVVKKLRQTVKSAAAVFLQYYRLFLLIRDQHSTSFEQVS